MGKQLSREELTLYRRTDEVLHYLWDRIGVATVPAARDEYDRYLPTVFSLLTEGSDEQEIAHYLDDVVREDMELEVSLARSLQIARILVEYRVWIAEHPEQPN